MERRNRGEEGSSAVGPGRPAIGIWVLVVLGAAVVASGCVGARRSGPHSATLSDAVRQSSKKEGERRRPLVVHDDDADGSGDAGPEIVVTLAACDEDASAHGRRTGRPRHRRRDRHDEPEVRFLFGAAALGGESDRDDGIEWSGGALRLGADVDRRWRGEVEFSYRELRPTGGRAFVALLDQEEWHVGGDLRHYLGSPHQFTRAYILLGASFGVLRWTYRSPIEVVTVDDWGYVTGHSWVHSDRLPTGTAYVGGGVALVSTPSFELGVNGRVGYQFYDDETGAGLYNDLIEDHPFGAMALEVTFIP